MSPLSLAPLFCPLERAEALLSEIQQEELALLEMARLEMDLWALQDGHRGALGPVREARAFYAIVWEARMQRWGHKPEAFHQTAKARLPSFNDPQVALSREETPG